MRASVAALLEEVYDLTYWLKSNDIQDGRSLPMTSPNVFIIESLKFDDEREDTFEGRLLSEILHLGGKESKYFYIRTKREMIEVMDLFKESDYRYLHLSCHGSQTSVSTTLDRIKLTDLSEIIGPYLREKRLFMSTCLAANYRIAEPLIPAFGVYSVAGPKKKVDFHTAAIAWAAFYHLMFDENAKSMKTPEIKKNLQRVSDTFRIPFNCFKPDKTRKKGYEYIGINPRPYTERSTPPK